MVMTMKRIANFLVGLLFNPDDGGKLCLLNVRLSLNYTILQPRRLCTAPLQLINIGRVSSIARYTCLHKMLHIILQAPVIQWIQHVQPVPMHFSMHIEPSVMDTVT
jgi:hypothetical protein